MDIYPPGYVIENRFEVLQSPDPKRHILVGGMGLVYICHDTLLDRAVALKTFKPEFLPNHAARDRFLREGTAWVALGKHPHIVRCHEVRYYDPTAFLVLELVVKKKGHADASLRSWMDKQMPLEQALAFILQIARGMQYATEKLRGFVHRDLKPENVLVGSDKLSGTEINRLQVTDFGLATMFQDETRKMNNESEEKIDEEASESLGRTQLTHGLVGTPLYMASEQWSGGKVGAYTDIYALGCILYELLTGERVANGKTITDLQTAHCAGKLNPLPGNLPSQVQAFLQCSLSLEGKDRYQTWDDALAALESACDEQGLLLTRLESTEISSYERRNLASSYIEIGRSYSDMGKKQIAIDYYQKALSISHNIGDRPSEGISMANLGNAYQSLGNLQRALECYEEALMLLHDVGDRDIKADVLSNLGHAYKALGDTQRAIEYYEDALKIGREIGDQQAEIQFYSRLGNTYFGLGDTQQAIQCYEKALNICREIGDRSLEGDALSQLGDMYLNLGDTRYAIGYIEQSLAIQYETRNHRGLGSALQSLGNIYLVLGDIRRASGYYQEALKTFREIGDRKGEGVVLGSLGNAYYKGDNLQHAIGYLKESLNIFREFGDQNGEGKTLDNLGSIYSELGDTQRAIEYYEEAILIHRKIININDVATSLCNLALLYGRKGETARAIPLVQEAERIFAQTGNQRLQQAQQLLAMLQGRSIPTQGNPDLAAFEAFCNVNDVRSMQIAVEQQPTMKEERFIHRIEKILKEQATPEDKPFFEQRLAWLRQIAGK